MVGKWHLCPTDEMNLAATAPQLAVRARVRALVRVPRRRDQPVVSRTWSTTTTRSTRRRRRRRATTSPTTSPTRRSSSSGTPRRSRRTSRSSSTTRRAPATRRTTRRRSGSTSSRAGSTWATRRCASRRWPARRRWASSRPTPSCRRSTRSARRETRTGPDGKPFPLMDVHPAVGLALRRREAALLADGRGLRWLPRARRPPHRPAARLPGVLGPAREHAGHPGLGQRRQRRGRPQRLGQREQALQRHPRRPRRRTSPCSTSWAARRPTTTTRTAGRWPSTRRSRCGSATSSTAAPRDPCIISWPAGMKAKGEIREQYHHAIDLVPTILDVLGVEAPQTIKGHVQSAFDGVSMRYSFDDATAPTARARRSSTRCSARAGIWHEGWKAVTTHPDHRRLEPLQRRRLGAVPHRRRPLRAARPGRRSSPDKLRELVRTCGSPRPARTARSRSTTARRWRSS